MVRILNVGMTASVLLAMVAAPANAQQGIAEVRGQVRDAQQAVLPGVTVVIRNQDTGMFRETATNTDGTYFISGVTPGVYEISAELEGFRPFSQRDVRLEIGKTTSINIQLEVGAVEEAVTVAAETPLVDVTTKEIGGHIDSRELTDLPSINRNYIGFVGLLPGIVPNISTESFGSDSISVSGQDSRNNNYLLDGANNNDDVIGQRAGTQARTPLESIQEFEVLTSQFDAEFGRSVGAVINAVTKQGTNRFRGSAFGYFQDAELTRRDVFAEQNDLEKPDTQQQQFGGTIGGPIAQDKAHFFFSLERVRIDEGITINTPARPELNTTTTEATRVWNTVLRFDQQLSANHQWAVRWLREDSPQFNQIIGDVTLAASREEADVDQTVVGTLSSVFGNTKLNTLRLAFTREDVAFANPGFNDNGGRQDLLLPTLEFLTFDDQQSEVAQARINNAYQIEDTFSWFVPGKRGDHDVKLGAQYQYSTNDFSNQGDFNGRFAFSGDGPFDSNNPRSFPERLFIRVPGPQQFFMKAHFLSAFAQDKWRLNDRLTLSLGLRYDVEVVPLRELDNPAFTDPDDYPVDTNNVQPRVGFSYDLTGAGRTVLRGGYGLFYDKTHFERITAIITSGVFSDSFVAAFPADTADPGPSNGQLPSEPLLRNGPVVDRELVNQLFPPGSTLRNTGTVVLDDPSRRIPSTHQVSAGFQHQLWPNVSLSADYVHAASRDLFMTFDRNAGMRVDSSRTGDIERPDPSFNVVNQARNLGETEYDALLLQFEKRFSQNYSTRVSYTLSYSRGNTSGDAFANVPFQLLDDPQVDLNDGPTNFDRRHNLVVSGSAVIPRTGGAQVSWVARYLSGLAFTVQDTDIDENRNGILFDPLPPGSFSGTGPNAVTAESDGGRNGARGPSFFQLDLRLGYRFSLGGDRRVDAFVDLFNVTDRNNFAVPDGDRFSTNFLALTNLADGAIPTTAQIEVRYSF
ncbi:MAG: TonB-dependent receptor plug domain-containing protein [Luteitalea sp.]|nr:TonB-dependent receptor plug domain-containing protein [Luteitalea sp.]